MTYDSLSGSVVMFNGFTQSGVTLSDVWSLGNSGWRRTENKAPSPDRYSGAADDPAHARLVAHSGTLPSGARAHVGGTWAWDGRGWKQLPDGPGLGKPQGFADPIRSRVVFAGAGEDGNPAQVWTLSGEIWTRLR